MSVADDIIAGLMCQRCGCYMPDYEAPGYPRTCPDCEREGGHVPRVECPVCGKKFREPQHMIQHEIAKHGAGEPQ